MSGNNKERNSRVSVSNENNVLLDPDVLTEYTTQILVLTVMATLVKYTNDENEMRVLYEYLAEASVVFPRVFSVIHSLLDAKITNRVFRVTMTLNMVFSITTSKKSHYACCRHSLLDAKITNVLSLCHDPVILNAVQAIILNLVACEDQHAAHQALYHLQGCGFGGLWRFAGPFTKSNCSAQNAELFVNCLEAMVETCLPGDDGLEQELAQYPSMLSVASANLSSSMSSLTLASPTEK
ncbi:hypothetical protein HAZT_HAZT005332, partial [Hyalella azteca]